MNTRIPAIVCALGAVLFTGLTASAAVLVPGLDTGDATFTGGASGSAGSATVTGHELGLTIGVDLTPAAGDTTGLVTLMEIGGIFNGSGLYLLEGVPTFISKAGDNGSNEPASLNDLSVGADNNVAMQSSFGAVSAGTSYKIHVVLDNANQVVEFAVNGKQDYFSLSGLGGNWNWSGDDGVNYLDTNGSTTSRGGLNTAGGSTDATNANDFAGSAVEGALWNATPNDYIVDLNPANAVFDESGDTSEYSSNSKSLSSITNSSGLTFNIAFTPDATDLSDSTLLMEIGGASNGTGLYLVDGVPVFLSKQNGGGGDTPASLNDNDLAGNVIALSHSFGALEADVEYVLAASLDPVNAQLTLLLRDGETGEILTDIFDIIGQTASGNWSGDDTLSVGAQHSTNDFSRGGTNTVSGDPFYHGDGTISDFAGVIEQATLWNAVIPTPAALPAGLALLGMMGLRRRCK